ncbi:hypothetical protein [Antrihabitans sp. YC2-6]|uniref:hypothetical protein n=1 Tax=Antrihabitans sp. YC2-6 TaxID=2799498 RepID=UPI0018F3F1EE|nr:hypothetical protein [Antrihabitans sp. YC2-6]MBJ8343381.1 hypothetical protein [Antrihabitans sp. YC2-6]
MTKRARLCRRVFARNCAIAAVLAIGTMTGAGAALADGGEGVVVTPSTPAAVPAKQYACVSAERAAADAQTASDVKTAADAKAASDAQAANAAVEHAKTLADNQAPLEERHAADVQVAITRQTADASAEAARQATDTKTVADAYLVEVADCQQAHGGVVPPALAIPAAVIPAVPAVLAAVPAIPAAALPVPAAVPGAGGLGAVEEMPGGLGANSVQTPAAEVATGRTASEILEDGTKLMWRWTIVAAWMVLLACGVMMAIGRDPRKVVPAGAAHVRRWVSTIRG